MVQHPTATTLFPYTTLFRSIRVETDLAHAQRAVALRNVLLEEISELTVVLGRRSAQKFPQEVHRSEEHTSELQSQSNLVCRLLLEKKKHNVVRDAVKLPDVS